MNSAMEKGTGLFTNMSKEDLMRILDEAGIAYREIAGDGYIRYLDDLKIQSGLFTGVRIEESSQYYNPITDNDLSVA